MKNNFEYYVDEINYFTHEGKSLILFRGWCFHSSRAPLSFHVKVNHEEIPCKTALMDRIDIVQGYLGKTNGIDVGFYVSAFVDGEINAAQLSVSCHRDHAVLSHLNAGKLKNIHKEGPVFFSIGIYHPSDQRNKKIELNGWAFSFDGSVLEYGIQDSSHQFIDSALQLFAHNELFELGLVDENSRICRFNIAFTDEANEPYYLVFHNLISPFNQITEKNNISKISRKKISVYI